MDKYQICNRCNNEVPSPLRFRFLGEGVTPINIKGLIPSLQEWVNIEREINRFYNKFPKRKITEYNKKIKSKNKKIKRKAQLIPGVVYLLRSSNGYYKIGRTSNIEERLSSLRRDFPIGIELIYTISCDNTLKIEQYLHQIYNEYKMQGEWFDLRPRHVEQIKEFGKVFNKKE